MRLSDSEIARAENLVLTRIEGGAVTVEDLVAAAREEAIGLPALRAAILELLDAGEVDTAEGRVSHSMDELATAG